PSLQRSPCIAINDSQFTREALQPYSTFCKLILKVLFGNHVRTAPSELAATYVPAYQALHPSRKRPPAGSVAGVFRALMNNVPPNLITRKEIASLVNLAPSTVFNDLQDL